MPSMAKLSLYLAADEYDASEVQQTLKALQERQEAPADADAPPPAVSRSASFAPAVNSSGPPSRQPSLQRLPPSQGLPVPMSAPPPGGFPRLTARESDGGYATPDFDVGQVGTVRRGATPEPEPEPEP